MIDISNKYNEIIAILMKNDRNATWDEIINEMKENYSNENEVMKYSIIELCESLETALEESDDVSKEFYLQQYLKAKSLLKD